MHPFPFPKKPLSLLRDLRQEPAQLGPFDADAEHDHRLTILAEQVDLRLP